ncbi:hypothetical protein GCM10009122_23100 [Fulvivirga kasyanovii]|uniref:Uncharacterized protein n=1 Tax=Fulvivirga kasyanovii TaxID=396812 RepID=A0ABW9S060_9BACT|nr:hypothetical protein [Fulvivirga kasyanovii]MTI28983.1 hypothetical protein [Fulvivirga kasyanovii]
MAQQRIRHGEYLKLEKFLSRWSLEKVKRLTLQEYSDTRNTDTFTYWLEFGSDELGRITGVHANKFGIWKRKKDEPLSSTYLTNHQYAWYRKYGNTEEDAFSKVLSLVIFIIESAQTGNFHQIDTVDIHAFVKWKLAFLYSGFKILPIYKQGTLREIAKQFEHPHYYSALISELHSFILNKKEKDEDFFQFAWKHYRLATHEMKRNYYIIGSKYDSVDMFPEMIRKGVISIGYLEGYEVEHLVGQSRQKIDKWLNTNVPNDHPRIKTAKRAVSFFLQLREGDLIAVKSHGRYGTLTIIGYAQVKKINGKIYQYDEELKHTIFVDFIEEEINIETGLSYGETIHRIIPGQREGHFEKIFGSYAINEQESDEDEDDDFTEKSTKPHVRRTNASTILVEQVHSKLQNAFCKYLRQKFPADKIKMEKKQVVDVFRKSGDSVFYYEIKPYNSAFSCIRVALGQLFDYSFSIDGYDSLKKNIIVVGPKEPLTKDLEFISYIKSTLNINFYYEWFNHKGNISQIY